jgi:type IV secretory pathway TrbF-like protein
MATSRLPYVVALDDVGRAVPVIPAKQVAVKDVRLQEAVVARWVTNLRTVIADAVAQRRLVDEVYAETGQNSPAAATITEFYSKNSPFDCAAVAQDI